MRFLGSLLLIFLLSITACMSPKKMDHKPKQIRTAVKKKAPTQKAHYSLNSLRGFQPLFRLPKLPGLQKMKYLVGKDPIISEGMDYSERAALTRKEKIFTLEKKLKMVSFSSPNAMGLISELLHLYKAQLYYLERAYLREKSSRVYPNKAHFLKVVAGMVVLHAGKLLKHYGHLPQKRSWKVDEVISRLRIDDRSAWQEAITLLQIPGYFKGKGRLLSVVKFETFVNHRRVLPASIKKLGLHYLDKTDHENKSIMYLLQAERTGIKQVKEKKRLIIKAIKFARKSDAKSKPGPIFHLSLWRLSELSYLINPEVPDKRVESVLNLFNLRTFKLSYYEMYALRKIKKDQLKAIRYYRKIFKFPYLTKRQRFLIQTRILDIALLSRQYPIIHDAWHRFMLMRKKYVITDFEERVKKTLDVFVDNAEKNPTPQHAKNFLVFYDLFHTYFKFMDRMKLHKQNVLKLLHKTSQWSILEKRAREMANQEKLRDSKLHLLALNYQAIAFEKIIGLSARRPLWNDSFDLSQKKFHAKNYVKTLSSFVDMSTVRQDKVKSLKQAIWVSDLIGDFKFSDKLLFKLNSEIKAKENLSTPLTWVLKRRVHNKQYSSAERLIRLAVKENIPLSGPFQADNQLNLENLLYKKASHLIKQKKIVAASRQLVEIAKEFLESQRSPDSLMKASRMFSQAGDEKSSVESLKLFLAYFTSHKLYQEAILRAAEKSEVLNQLEDALQYYQLFAQNFPEAAKTQSVWMKCARIATSLKKYALAKNFNINAYTESQSVTRKIFVAKNIISNAFALKQYSEVLHYLNIILDLHKDKHVQKTSDEDLWALSKKIKVLQHMGEIQEASNIASDAMTLTPRSLQGQHSLAEIYYAVGMFRLRKLSRNLFNRKVSQIIDNYQTIKQTFLKVCEFPGSPWCSVAYYQVSHLASSLYEKSPNRSRLKEDTEQFYKYSLDSLNIVGAPSKALSLQIKNRTKVALDHIP